MHLPTDVSLSISLHNSPIVLLHLAF
jgi:hypothetical protein